MLVEGPGSMTRKTGFPWDDGIGKAEIEGNSSAASKMTWSPGRSSAGGDASGSNIRSATRPISRHPPGVSPGYTPL